MGGLEKEDDLDWGRGAGRGRTGGLELVEDGVVVLESEQLHCRWVGARVIVVLVQALVRRGLLSRCTVIRCGVEVVRS